MRTSVFALLVTALALAGCARETPLQPTSSSTPASSLARSASGRIAPGRPGYEAAYVDGQTVTINAIEVPNHAPMQAQADFYEVVYPTGWEQMGLAPPQCNPCDHDNNGIDAQDYHDHVLDSKPGIRGYRALWHVYAVVPAYNGDPTHDAAVNTAYKAALPLKSEAALNAFLAQSLPGGGPAAVKIDAQFYFLCAVVGGPHPIP